MRCEERSRAEVLWTARDVQMEASDVRQMDISPVERPSVTSRRII